MKKAIVGSTLAVMIAGCAGLPGDLGGSRSTRTFSRVPLEVAVCVQRNTQNASLPYVATFADNTNLIVKESTGEGATVATMLLRAGAPSDIWVSYRVSSHERFLDSLLAGC